MTIRLASVLIILVPLAQLVALTNYDDVRWIDTTPGPHELDALTQRYGMPLSTWTVVTYNDHISIGGRMRVLDLSALVAQEADAHDTTSGTEVRHLEFGPPQRVQGYRPYTVIAEQRVDGWYLWRNQLVTFMP